LLLPITSATRISAAAGHAIKTKTAMAIATFKYTPASVRLVLDHPSYRLTTLGVGVGGHLRIG
jgi:hypothetical protein